MTIPCTVAQGAAIPLARMFAAPRLDGIAIRAGQFSPDGRHLAYLRDRPDAPDCFDLWLADTAGQAPPRRLLDAAQAAGPLTAEEQARRERQRSFGEGVGPFRWSACAGFLVTGVAGVPAAIDVMTGAIRPVAPAGSTDIQPAPAGRRLAFVHDRALWSGDLDGAKPQRVSAEPEDGISHGTAEFVAQEEFARDTGFWWRPDGGAIAYTRVDERPVMMARRIEMDAQGPRIVEQRFPRTGTANAIVSLLVRMLDDEREVTVDLGTDPDVYLVRVNWSLDGQTLFVQRQSRDQRCLDLLAADPQTGRTHLVLREAREPWVNPNLDFRPLSDGGFLWVSERSGTNQLYRYGPDGRCIAQLTDGPEPLASRDRERGLVGVDEAAGLAYVMTGKDGVLERHLHAVPIGVPGTPAQLTREPGWWDVAMSGDAKVFVGTCSHPSRPPATAVYRSDGERVCWIEANTLGPDHPYAPFAAGLPEPEFGTLAAEDGQRLDFVLLRPAGFDPSRRYPVIVQVYGGPGRQHVRKAWRSVEERAFLDAGYVLFQLDNRGASGRGLAFEAPIAGRLGESETADQLRGIAWLKSLPFIDPDRMGVMGWSYGGFMTLRLMTEPGSGLRAGIAGGSIATWDGYDTHYTEHYLGRPQDAPQAYRAASVLPRLARLKGRLLLVHGMADDNVLIDHALAIMAELQRLGHGFDLMLYPDQRHAIVGEPAQRHRLMTYRDFFDRELADRHG